MITRSRARKAEDLSADAPHTEFDLKAIRVTTIPNDGIVTRRRGGSPTKNACFFIALYDSLCHSGRNAHTATPYDLLIESEYPDGGYPIDTDDATHKGCLVTIADLTRATVIVYVGQQVTHGVWRINPEELGERIGTGGTIVRLVNDGTHFEAITSEFT